MDLFLYYSQLIVKFARSILPTSASGMKKKDQQFISKEYAPTNQVGLGGYPADQNTNHPKLQQHTQQFFHSVLSKSEQTNATIVEAFKALNLEETNKLQQYCLAQFDNLPLFLLYQLGQELGLSKISSACSLELINENFQQLNYSKFDLIKCSLVTFQKILTQYSALVKSLQIQGLKPSNLKSIIDDYCSMRDVDSEDKNYLYNRFVPSKEILIPASCEVRRSMIETTNTKMQFSASVKLEKMLQTTTNPLLPLSQPQHLKQEKTKIDTYGPRFNDQITVAKLQIEQHTRKQQLLLSQIIEVRQKYSEYANDRIFKTVFKKLEETVSKMQIQIRTQNQKLEKIKKVAQNMQVKNNGMDFIFSF